MKNIRMEVVMTTLILGMVCISFLWTLYVKANIHLDYGVSAYDVQEYKKLANH